ncbi:MAG: hypothetical protein RIQ94_3319 [Pseudomonadota bacterium]|jgi:hypothetical protein
MKKLGILALILGLIGLVFSIQMDTSVSSYGGGRINNLGLMSLQQNLVFICSTITIVGVFLIVMAGRSNGSNNSLNQNQSVRECPFCAETIKSQAVLCRYCGKDVIPVPVISIPSPKLIDKIGSRLNSLERFFAIKYSAFLNVVIIKIIFSKLKLILTFLNDHLKEVSSLLVFLGFLDFVYLLTNDTYGSSYALNQYYVSILSVLWKFDQVLPIIFTGAVLYFRPKLVNCTDSTVNNEYISDIRNHNSSSILHFLKSINLIKLEATLLILMIVFFDDEYVPLVSESRCFAYFFGVVSLIVSCFIFKQYKKIPGVLLFCLSFLYLFYQYGITSFLHDSSMATLAQEMLESYEPPKFELMNLPFVHDIKSYLIILVLSAINPGLKILSFFGMNYGQLCGDRIYSFKGRNIFMPLTSAIVFYFIWRFFWGNVGIRFYYIDLIKLLFGVSVFNGF